MATNSWMDVLEAVAEGIAIGSSMMIAAEEPKRTTRVVTTTTTTTHNSGDYYPYGGYQQRRSQTTTYMPQANTKVYYISASSMPELATKINRFNRCLDENLHCGRIVRQDLMQDTYNGSVTATLYVEMTYSSFFSSVIYDFEKWEKKHY